ncbi:MAG: hypothetical protein C4530_20895 [Desulfobacteraceae bacterium]|nr:MAG: hypothetical protein C4530_20895 [Desulfobacteraceae bacterium]
MTYTLVDDIAKIDLTRHALIEASAGTGKTYTLENLVVRLLKERQDVALENILVVTFTEKATSELKLRIRQKLEQEIGESACESGVEKIRDTLDAFDTASIYTIHGFCHTVLKDFAFENGSLFQNELVDDTPIFDALLREQMRKDWPQTYGSDLPEILRAAGFAARKDRLLSMVATLARRVFRPDVGDEIRPDADGRSFRQIRSAIVARLLELKTLIGAAPAFSEGFNRLNINARSKKSLMEKMVTPLEDYLSRFDENRFEFEPLLELIERIQTVKSSDRQGIECLVPANWTKAGENIQVCSNLETISDCLACLAEAVTDLSHYLAVDAVKTLQTDAARFKRRNGWISYEDMLSRVASALHDAHSTQLMQTLRAKYKVAFVDEFQDTDPVQWRIFERLFLDRTEKSCRNLLFLIGDPKQAIYSFRGADVYAYLEARNKMERLAESGSANRYSLTTNWRSKPELVAAFNRLFCCEEWFPPQDRAGAFEIGYQDAGSPNEEDLPVFPAADRSGRPVLNFVDLRQSESPGRAKPALARFIAAEIRHLIDSGGIEIEVKNSGRRPLDYGDICILVRGRSDALLLEPELANRYIPYSFYKKPGLFLSDEALYLSLMCRAVSGPGNLPDTKKALLTPFFAYKTDDLHAVETLPVSHPLKQLLFHWHGLARSRRWGLLFQSLMEDSGLLFREAGTRDWDRKYTNYRQIFEHLEDVSYRKNLDFRGLSALLDSYRKQTVGAEEDADIHQIETEARKVQIMTMHVSKGLEFPVVFIAGGLTQTSVDAYHVYHDSDPERPEKGIRKIIDLSKKCGRERHDRERNEEDKRLLYVALTRARFKLYVPFLPIASGYRWVGPVCRFLSSAVSSAFQEGSGSPGAGWLAPDTHRATGPGGAAAIGGAIVSESTIQLDFPLLPLNKSYQARRTLLESFSSLHSRLYRGHLPETGFRVVREKDRQDDESDFAFDSDPLRTIRPEAELPGGADMGSMFHDIFEHIDFQAATGNPEGFPETAEAKDLIVEIMNAYRVENRWLQQVCRMVADTLTTTVHAGEQPILLSRVKKEDRIHEVEFYYPFTFPAGGMLNIPDCEIGRGNCGFIRGFVDLIFRHNGKYFIVDWKSNRIEAGYGRKALEACMKDAGYYLQYKLYAVAVRRWLKQALGDRFDPDRQLGGVFYLFLRGMGAGNGNGVYFVSPAELGDLERIEAEIAKAVR